MTRPQEPLQLVDHLVPALVDTSEIDVDIVQVSRLLQTRHQVAVVCVVILVAAVIATSTQSLIAVMLTEVNPTRTGETDSVKVMRVSDSLYMLD